MTHIQRDDPCPCGSGKKHEHCCGHQDRGADAVALALAWLDEHYEDAMLKAFAETFFAGLSEEAFIGLVTNLPDNVVEVMHANGRELLLAEGNLGLEDGNVPCLVLVLEPGRMSLDADQRDYLETLSRRSMSLYRVLESRPGIGFDVRDLLDEDESVYRVEAPIDSQSLAAAEGAAFGARLMPSGSDASWRISGGLYPQHGPDLVERLQEFRAELADESLDFGERRTRSLFLVYEWLYPLSVASPGLWQDALKGLEQPS